MALASPSDDTPYLPPISVIDDYLPNRTWQPPPPPATTPSPPLPRQPYLPQQPSAFSTHLTHTSFSDLTPSPASTNPDVAQAIHHCQHLCESIAHHRNAWSEEEDPRLWLDDMIEQANQVLNALLRLRKHQPHVRPHVTSPGTPYYYPPTLSSSASTPASSSSAYPPSPASSIHRLRHHQRQRRGKSASFRGRCHSCNISETPEWRRGPDGARTLCNACGLHYAKLTRKKAAASAATATASATQPQQPQHHR